jgi:divalent metal cation (Fe/Co/Zn/Cd) transporter
MKNLKLITPKNLTEKTNNEVRPPMSIILVAFFGMVISISMLLMGYWIRDYGNSLEVIKYGLSSAYEQSSQLYIATGGTFFVIFGLFLILFIAASVVGWASE